MFSLELILNIEFLSPIVIKVQDDGESSIMELVENAVIAYQITTDGKRIIVSNFKEEIKRHSKVVFIDNNTFNDFLYEPDNSLLEIADLSNLNLVIDIGGIGGEVGEENGIHYYIYSRDEHPPRHVHCKKQSKKCKCLIDNLEIIDAENSKTFFTSKEKKIIREYISNNKARIITEWNRLNPFLA